MPWIWLFLAACLEVAWAVGLKLSDGLTRPAWTVFTLVTMIGSFGLLAQAMKGLPMGTAYAVWTGFGAVGVALVGICCFGEPASFWRLTGLSLILAGLVCLKLTSPV